MAEQRDRATGGRRATTTRPGASPGTRPVRHRRVAPLAVIGILLSTLAMLAPTSGATAATAAPGLEGFSRVERSEPSPGVFVERWQRASPPMVVHVARVTDQAKHRLRVEVSNELLAEPDPATRRERTSRMCLRAHCVVAINSDQFLLPSDGRISGVPVGAVVRSGELVTTPRPIDYAHATIDETGEVRGSINPPAFQAQLEAANGSTLPLDGFNRDLEAGSGVGLLTPRWWGPHTLGLDTDVEWLLPVAGNRVADGSELELRPRRHGGGALVPGTAALVGRGAGIPRAEQFIGEAGGAGATVRLAIDVGGAEHAVGGSPLLLDEGRYGFPTDGSAGIDRHPRTVLGWSPGGDTLLVTIDGRQPGYSEGATLVEAARALRSLGATGALNLDGGGTTTFVEGLHVKNRPSDAGNAERPASSAIVVGPPEGFDFGVARARSLAPYCADGTASSFSDVTSANVHAGSIGCLDERGLVAGRTATTYEPAGPVSRAQMASFVARALWAAGTPLPNDPPDAFPDDEGSVHEPNIDILAALGIVRGSTDGMFRPRSDVTRAQTARYLVGAWAVATGDTTVPSRDFHIDDSLDVHEVAINRISELGIMTGPAAGVFHPQQGTRRDQMASVVARFMAGVTEDDA